MLNTEQTLTRVLQIVHALDEDEAAIYNAVSKNPYEWEKAVGPIPQLYFLEQDLRRTLVEEAATKSGRRSAFFAARRICDAAVAKNSTRPASQGFWIDEEGKQCVCDGYRGFRLNSPMEMTAAPELSADGSRFNLAQIIAPTRKNTLRLTLPSVTEVRAKIKTDRAEWAAKRHRKGETFSPYYDFGPGLPRVNPNYLIDFLQLFPDGEAFASEQKPYITPIYFRSADGEGILCPCRKADEAAA